MEKKKAAILQKRLGRKRSGFMLLELIIVIAIIGILAAVAVPDFLGMSDEAKIARIKADLHTINTAAEMYNIKEGKYPADVTAMVSKDAGKGYLRSEPEPPDKSVKYAINSTTGEVTATFKGVTYSSYGTSTESSGT